MGDIITTFAKIGSHYLEDEKRVKNKAYEYKSIKVYLFDIENKSIEPSVNVPYEDLIITRFGVGANSGNLFPNLPYEPKDVKKDFDKFVRGILKANKNLLSFFTEDEINENKILTILSSLDSTFFADVKESLQNLEKYQEKGKVATYLSLSYHNRPVSAYFKDIYEQHLNKSEKSTLKGFDIITNEEGVGGDANLAFCSVNELPTKLKSVKHRLLPLSHQSAKKVKIGFDAMDKMLSHNFYGLKLAIMPTVLSDDEKLYGEILEILEKSAKGKISEVKESENYINYFIESVAESEKSLPVLNTILFYNKSNAAVDVLLQIDDILPSFITHIAKSMEQYNIKAFKEKDSKDSEETIYLQNLFDDRLEIMNLLLSSQKIDVDVFTEKLSQLIYWGNINKKYAYPVDWSKYFNGYYSHRSIEAINRYVQLFSEINKFKKSFILQKEYDVSETENRQKMIEELMQNSPFLENDVLKSAYLLGMLSSAIMNWQYAVSGTDSYSRWLNSSGIISKDSLPRIWKKAEETVRKLNATSGKGNKTVNAIMEMVIEQAPQAFVSEEIVKSAYVSLAFAMGGTDYTKHIKTTKDA